MAIKALGEVIHIVRSPFNSSKHPEKVEIHIIRLTGRYTIFAGSSAILLTILTQCLKQNALPSWTSALIKASLVSGATSAAILICSVYQCLRGKNNPPYDNRNTLYFERVIEGIVIAVGGTMLIALKTLKQNKTFGPFTRYCQRHFFFPLAICGWTALIIAKLHDHKINRAIKF